MADHKSPVVLITGCSKGGIGFEYCKAFAELGCHVIASDLPGRLPEIAGVFEESVEIDVTSDSSVAAAVAAVVGRHGRIDMLVNNAGVGAPGPLAELPLDAVREAWEVNALGQLRMVQAAARHMVARRSGTVVNVGSVVGRVATPWTGAYCASKAWIHATSDSLRAELAPFGVHVVEVVPGSVRSGFGMASLGRLANREWVMYREFTAAIAERAAASQGRKATPAEELAKVVARRVVMRRRPPREIVYGHLTGLFAALAWSPGWVRDLLFRYRFGLNRKL